MFETVLSSPLLEEVAQLIESRLGRPLEPFDIWYSGFRPRGAYTEAELDEIVAKRYPTAEAYEKDMPNSAGGARLLEGAGGGARQRHRRRPRPGLRPRLGRGHAGLEVTPPDPRGPERDGLQGLQHRGPRDGAQRRADHLHARGRPHPAPGRPQHRLHRGPGLRLPGPRPGAPRPGLALRREPGPAGPRRLLGRRRDRVGGARGHGRVALDVRAPRGHARPSCARPPWPSPGTSGTPTGRRSSARGTACSSASTPTWSRGTCTCPTTPSAR